MKKILVFLSDISTHNMVKYLQELEYEVVIYGNNDRDYIEVTKGLLDSTYYAVFTYNFYPELSALCNERKIYYISWIVDNPHFSLEAEEVFNPINRMFSFDKEQVKQLIKRGVNYVFHLPLGVDVEGFHILANDKKKFNADVAFVGNLYNDNTHNLYQQIAYLPPYSKGYINAMIQAQQKIGDNIFIPNAFPKRVWEELHSYIKFEESGKFRILYESQIINIIQKEVTKRERCGAVSLLNHFFDFRLYTGSSLEFDSNLKNAGYVDYKTEMPLVFHNSKININITLRSITSGIPLRALDIMACEGFLLSNCQKELREYFIEDKECVFYYDLEDMIDKCAYYLSHDEERKAIAEAGHQKVKEEFSLKGQLARMKDILEENE